MYILRNLKDKIQTPKVKVNNDIIVTNSINSIKTHCTCSNYIRVSQ